MYTVKELAGASWWRFLTQSIHLHRNFHLCHYRKLFCLQTQIVKYIFFAKGRQLRRFWGCALWKWFALCYGFYSVWRFRFRKNHGCPVGKRITYKTCHYWSFPKSHIQNLKTFRAIVQQHFKGFWKLRKFPCNLPTF